jgi:hypothetical protein
MEGGRGNGFLSHFEEENNENGNSFPSVFSFRSLTVDGKRSRQKVSDNKLVFRQIHRLLLQSLERKLENVITDQTITVLILCNLPKFD